MENLKTYAIDEALINASKLHQEIDNSNFIESFVGLQLVADELFIYGNSIINETALDKLVDAHNPVDLLASEIALYDKRIFDGRVALISLMSELRLNSLVNNYPRIVNASIENSFWEVAIAINNGWWITAKEKCELVPVAGYVTQPLWDKIHNKIVDYIAQNY